MKCCFITLFLLITTKGFSQSLLDSLFSGKMKVDSAKVFKKNPEIKKDTAAARISLSNVAVKKEASKTEVDSIILISVDTSNVALENAKMNWRKWVEMNTPVPFPGEYKMSRGLHKIMVEFKVGPDGTVELEKIICEPGLESWCKDLEKHMKHPPKQIPNHNGIRYIKTIKKQPISFISE